MATVEKRRGRGDRAGSLPGLGAPGSYKPVGISAGVQRFLDSGLVLGTYSGGNFNVTQSGTPTNPLIIENLNIHARVRIAANVHDVTFRKCLVDASAADKNATSESGSALIECYNAGIKNIVIEDCTLRPNPLYATWSLDGVLGHDFTLQRCDVSLVADGMGIYNNNANSVINGVHDVNVFAYANYFHDAAYFAPTSSGNSDNQTHNDVGAQILGGSNIHIVGNNIQSFCSTMDPLGGRPNEAVQQYPNGITNTHYPTLSANACIQINTGGAALGIVPQDIWITDNWMDGGGASINISRGTGSNNIPYHDIHIKNNKFGHNQYNQGAGGDDVFCTLGVNTTDSAGSNYAMDVTGNVFEDNGHAIRVR